MRQLWPFVRPQWRLLGVALMLIPLAVGFDLAQPILIKIAIDVNVGQRTTDGLWLVLVLFGSSALLAAVCQHLHLYTLAIVGQRTSCAMRVKLYDHVLSQRTGFYDQVPVGHLVTRITSDVEAINEVFTTGVVTLVADVIRVLGIAIAMLVLDWRLALITILTFPLLAMLFAAARPVLRRAFREVRLMIAAMSACISEAFNGIKTVVLYCAEARVSGDLEHSSARFRDGNVAVHLAEAALSSSVHALGIAAAAGIAWWGGSRMAATGLTVGLVIAFIEYVNKLFAPLNEISSKYAIIQSAVAGAERIFEMLERNEPEAPLRSELAREVDAADSPAIVFRDVSFAYRPSEPLLCGFELTVPRNSTVAIVGPSGSGKSTVIRLLTRLYEPDGGQILLDGRDLRSWPAQEVRAKVVVAGQDAFLFSGTVGGNIRLGRPDASREQIEEALAHLGADHVLARRGVGIDAAVAERGTNFSAGERQLISFARALIARPEILVLDEATAQVDPEIEQVIEQAVRVLMQDRTTLVIAHRLSTIEDADAIAFVSRGQVAEFGPRAELLRRGGLYARLEQAFRR